MVMPRVLNLLLRLKEFDAACWLAPWTLLDVAVAREGLDDDSRLALIQASFSLFAWADAKFPNDIPQRASHGPITPFTRNQLNRAMNLCVGLFHAITDFRAGLSLGRVGSHALECHFGAVRAVLRSDDRWDRWLSAEAHAILVQRFLDELGVPPVQRRSRAPVSGVVLWETDEGLASLDMAEWEADAVIRRADS
jgi:hypothetical protein